jgi:RES domain-containing protein
VEVYRITHRKWANKLFGSGYAARWNSNGFLMVYAAESRSLACLENLVHRNGFGIDNDFCVITISIPDSVKTEEILINKLPINWNFPDENSHLLCRTVGDNWLKKQSSCVLIVPSAIIVNEKNVLINPNHIDFDKIIIKSILPFSFDNRLK